MLATCGGKRNRPARFVRFMKGTKLGQSTAEKQTSSAFVTSVKSAFANTTGSSCGHLNIKQLWSLLANLPPEM